MITSEKVKDFLMNYVKQIEGDIALILSNGVDSQSLFFALIESKINFSAYSFTLADRESSDFKGAKELCNKYGVKFTPCILPCDVDTLEKEAIELIRNYGCRKKTEVECIFPFYHLFPIVKEKNILTGLGAEGVYGNTKKGKLHYKDRLDDWRAEFYGATNVAERNQREILARHHAKVLYDPYCSKELQDLFAGATWEEINVPHEKQITINAFERFKDVKSTKANLQKGDSGIADSFEQLLTSKFNTKGYKSVVGVYNEIYRQIEKGVL